MHGLDESEDIAIGDTVVVIGGDNDGRLGIVDSIDHAAYRHGPDRNRSCYVVAFPDDNGFFSIDAIYYADETHPPALLRISSEEATVRTITVFDTIGV